MGWPELGEGRRDDDQYANEQRTGVNITTLIGLWTLFELGPPRTGAGVTGHEDYPRWSGVLELVSSEAGIADVVIIINPSDGPMPEPWRRRRARGDVTHFIIIA